MTTIGYEKNNLFGLLKYWAAYAVLMLHYDGFWRIYRGYTFEVERVYNRINVFPPVIIFLAISGYLTAGSLARDVDMRSFFKKKIKRIYIPLWISTLIYLITYLIIAKDHINSSIIVWIFTNSLGVAYTPSCLDDFASGSANGVLWTITILLELYIVSGFLWKYIRKLSAKVWFTVILPALALLNILSAYLNANVLGSIGSKLLERLFIPYAVFFFTGFALYMYKEKIGLWMQVIGIVSVLAVLWLNMQKAPDYGYYTGIIRGMFTTLATIGIGSWSPDSIGDHGAGGLLGLICRLDVTYEMYLYQWLVINVFIYLGLYDTLEWYNLYDYLERTVIIVAVITHLINVIVIRLVRAAAKRRAKANG